MHPKLQEQLIEQFTPEKIIEILHPYVSDQRKSRIERIISLRLDSIQLALESPSDMGNALATIRSCESLGINSVHIIQPEGEVIFGRGISEGAIYWSEVTYYPQLNDFLKEMKSKSILLGGAVMSGTISLEELPLDQPLCLIFGNEHRGLSKEAITACDFLYQIPMFGMTESYNLSVAAAISIYELTIKKRKSMNDSGDLKPDAKNRLRAKYYLNSVNERLTKALLNPC